MRQCRFRTVNAGGAASDSVTVTPSSGSVMLGNQFLFTAAVKNSSDSTVTWSVNGVAGGAVLRGSLFELLLGV
jgi:hypothetical protein